jgi:translation initiation factor RLI1
MDNRVQNHSSGELQRLAICLALGTSADVYLVDEPSAYLDSEQRINCAKAIKRFIMHSKRLHLSWSTISSWPLISPIGWLSTRDGLE